MRFCQECGRRTNQQNRFHLCKICQRKVPARQPGEVSILQPRDDEMEMIYDGLIAQRKRTVLESFPRLMTDDPAEERALRAIMELPAVNDAKSD